jgi:ferritin-like metal-binding protein YciE
MPTTKTKKAESSKSNEASTTRSSEAENSAGQVSEQFEKFFSDQIKDIYWAEKHLTKALPKMQKAATSEELQEAIENHLAQTEEHVTRLEQVFELLGKKPQAKKCDGMEGLVKEGEHVIEETEDGSMIRDAGIIIAAQKVEHYEISAYGSLVQLAKTMGNEEIANLLSQTLEEEKETDELLTQLAENNINQEAEEESEEDVENEEEEDEK